MKFLNSMNSLLLVRLLPSVLSRDPNTYSIQSLHDLCPRQCPFVLAQALPSKYFDICTVLLSFKCVVTCQPSLLSNIMLLPSFRTAHSPVPSHTRPFRFTHASSPSPYLAIPSPAQPDLEPAEGESIPWVHLLYFSPHTRLCQSTSTSPPLSVCFCNVPSFPLLSLSLSRSSKFARIRQNAPFFDFSANRNLAL